MTEQRSILEWLRETRGISEDIIWEYGIREYCRDDKPPAIAIPYRRNDKPYAWKFRTENKEFWASKGVSRGLWNEDALNLGGAIPIVITEGEIDALSCIQAGYERCVSVPDGWSENKAHDDALVAEEKRLKDSPYVIVAGDADQAGASLPRYVANLLAGHEVRAATWPEDCKDANDVLCKHGAERLRQCLDFAKVVDPPGGLITGLSDLPMMPDRRVLKVGAMPFDRVIALELGALSVWTGIPGSGKSTFILYIADRITKREKVRAGLIMFETHPYAIREQLSLMAEGMSFSVLPEHMRSSLLADWDRRFRIVQYRPHDDIRQTMDWLWSMVRALALRDGCRLVIIDPWNEIEHVPNPGETMTAYINWALKTMRQWAEQLVIHIALVAHPRKLPIDNGNRPPTGYDIADSAQFFNKPSLGLTVHQRREEGLDGEPQEWVEVIVWKVRDTLLYGFERGRIQLDFNRATRNYSPRERRRS